jgi:hypothetical protein
MTLRVQGTWWQWVSLIACHTHCFVKPHSTTFLEASLVLLLNLCIKMVNAVVSKLELCLQLPDLLAFARVL